MKMQIASIFVGLIGALFAKADRAKEEEQPLVDSIIATCKVSEMADDLSAVKISMSFTVSNISDSMLFIGEPNPNADVVIEKMAATLSERKIRFHWSASAAAEFIALRNFRLLDKNRNSSLPKVGARSEFSDRYFKIEFKPSQVLTLTAAEFEDNQKIISEIRKMPKVQTFSISGYVRLHIVDSKSDRTIVSKLPFDITWKPEK